MKQKLIIIPALVLLLAVIAYMTRDLFFIRSAKEKNPYDFGMDRLRTSDSSLLCFSEVLTFSPAVEEIHGISSTAAGTICVAGSGGVELFSPEGKPLKRLPVEGTVQCLSITPYQTFLLGMTDHVVIMDSGGTILQQWEPVSSKSLITSLATNGSDVFVADAGERIVYRYDFNGRLIGRIGEQDSVRGIPGFVIPSGYFDLAIGRDEELWVVNPGRHLLEAFRPDGTLISTWGESSTSVDGFCGCCNPSHIVVLPDGSFVTSEKGIERIKLIRPSGEFNCLVATPDQFDEGTKGIDLAVDPQGRILVLDPVRKQVRIFASKTTIGHE
jgi:sugar lactone lactonase YvrE